jgi:hypothetical protein
MPPEKASLTGISSTILPVPEQRWHGKNPVSPHPPQVGHWICAGIQKRI